MPAGPFGTALGLIASGDPQLMEIIRLSLGVTLTALRGGLRRRAAARGSAGAGALPGRGGAVVVAFNALMGLPPVVAGLVDLPAAVALRAARRRSGCCSPRRRWCWRRRC